MKKFQKQILTLVLTGLLALSGIVIIPTPKNPIECQPTDILPERNDS